MHARGERAGGLMEGFGAADGACRQAAEVGVIERQHLVGHVHGGDIGTGLGPLGNELAQVPVARPVAARGVVMEHVVGRLRQQCHRAMVAAHESTCAVGQVAQFVRVDGDRVGLGQCRSGRMHARAREMREAPRDLVAGAQSAILVAEQGGEVAAPGGIHVHREAQPA